MKNAEMTLNTALQLLARAEMCPFTPMDWSCFAGCQSTNPLIGEVDDMLVLLDGDVLVIYTDPDSISEEDVYTFELNSY